MTHCDSACHACDAWQADDVARLCLLARESECARNTLYDHYGINDEDRNGIVAHLQRHAVGW